MRQRVFPLLLALLVLGGACASVLADDAKVRPNIVYILADDLGYGDVKYLNPEGKIATPCLDRLAAQGMAFTDAHSGSSVCTPTRYGVLTGRYAWRTHLQSGVLQGYSAPLIAADRLTVPALLKQQGYATACIGKWHLGMDLAEKQKAEKISNGPTTVGFDYFYGISASLDMPPFAFIENDHFTQQPTATKTWGRKGAAAPDFEAVDVLPTLAQKAAEWITAHKAEPFFLYLPLNSPHTPIVPTKAWQGKSGINAYADFVMETDYYVGQVLAALEKSGVADRTLVIFTSDNGCSPAANLKTLNEHGHEPSYIYRGHKADIWDGGHRVPFLVRWPGKVAPGSKTGQITCHTDLMATCADILGVKLPEAAGVDSYSMLPALTSQGAGPRESVVHHSIKGKFSLRSGPWKLELCPGSGGWGDPGDAAAEKLKLPDIQLYDMEHDPSETKNLALEKADLVAKMTEELKSIVTNGRSTAGPKQENDVAVKIIKPEK